MLSLPTSDAFHSRSLAALLTFGAVLLSLAAAAPTSYRATPVDNGGWIAGRISYSGNPPSPKETNPTTDAPVCGQHGLITSDELVVSKNKGLQYAVIRLTDIHSGRPVSDLPVSVLNENGCMFRPHVLIVPVGRRLTERNADGILHNIHTHSVKNPPVNLAHPPSVPEIPLASFTAPELVKATCDIHNWMLGWIWVTDHPYIAVTDRDGMFKISSIPPGKYRVEVWQEALGKASREVTIVGGKETRLDLALPASSASVAASSRK